MSKDKRSKYDDATEFALAPLVLPSQGAAVPAQPAAPPAESPDATLPFGSGPSVEDVPPEILALRAAYAARVAAAQAQAVAPPAPPQPAIPQPPPPSPPAQRGYADETMVLAAVPFPFPSSSQQPQAPVPPAQPVVTDPLAALLAAGPPPSAAAPRPSHEVFTPIQAPAPTYPAPADDMFARLAAPPPVAPAAPAPAPAVTPAPWGGPTPDRTFEMPAEAAPAGFGAYPAQPAQPAAPAYAPPAAAQPYTPPWTPPTPPTPAPWSPPPQPAAPVPWAQPQPPPAAPQPVAPPAARPAQRGRNMWNFDDPTGAFMVEDVEVRNKTEATVVVRPVGSGALVVIKQRFFANRRGELAMVPGATIQEADEAHADVIGSSLRVPSDFAGQKAGTDVVILGDAIAPRGGARRVDVRVRVGPAQRLLAVFGMRTWHKGRFLGGLKLTEATPFDRCPLRWELAFGGGDDPLNPVGVGRAASLENTLAPRVEDPSALLSDERSRPLPAGVAPIAADWPTRVRCQPGDPRREHSAAPGLTTQGYLQGGEPFEFVGMHEDGELRGTLPRHGMLVEYRTPEAQAQARAVLDGVLVLPNERVFFLTWRLHLPTVEDLRTVRVTELPLP